MSRTFTTRELQSSAASIPQSARYQLYYQHASGRREWIVNAENQEQARLLARIWSRSAEMAVTIILKLIGGSEAQIAMYKHGNPIPPRADKNH